VHGMQKLAASTGLRAVSSLGPGSSRVASRNLPLASRSRLRARAAGQRSQNFAPPFPDTATGIALNEKFAPWAAATARADLMVGRLALVQRQDHEPRPAQLPARGQAHTQRGRFLLPSWSCPGWPPDALPIPSGAVAVALLAAWPDQDVPEMRLRLDLVAIRAAASRAVRV
jgi:hypothetical protein